MKAISLPSTPSYRLIYSKYITFFLLGERLVVQAEIENSSSRNLKPKYKLDKKITYIAHSSTKTERDTIFKEEGSPIPSKDHQTVTQELRIPMSLPPTILFCKILRVEYKLKVLYHNILFNFW